MRAPARCGADQTYAESMPRLRAWHRLVMTDFETLAVIPRVTPEIKAEIEAAVA